MAEKDDDLTSMKRPPGGREHMGVPMAASRDEYSYGLCIRLENHELDKLKLAMPQIGKEFTIRAVGKVTAVHESKSEHDKDGDRAVTIQITAIAMR